MNRRSIPVCLLLLLLLACGQSQPQRVLTPDETYLWTLAAETWSYLDSHLSPRTGFPTDSQRPGGNTNTTNIGLYLAALGPAERMGFIGHDSAVARARRIIESVNRLESRHGFLPNWISVDGDTKLPEGVFAVSDFNKLVCGLILVRQFYPELAAEASALVDRVEWKWLYDAAAQRGHWGFDLKNDKPVGRADFWLASDCRLAVFSMIASGAAPATLWDVMGRRRISSDGLTFFEPGYEFGGLFMQALDSIFLDERGTEMGRSIADLAWHQIRMARERQLPAWGWSNCNIPGSGYTEGGFLPWWVVTPHATALVIDYYPRHALENLRSLEKLGARAPLEAGKTWGFRDSFDLKTRRSDDRYLALDQAMLFLALANHLEKNIVRSTFASDPFVAKGIAILGDRLKTDPALLAEWARRDATEPDTRPLSVLTEPLVLDFTRGAVTATATGGAVCTNTPEGLRIEFDISSGGEADVNIPVRLDGRALGDIVIRGKGQGEGGPLGGVRVLLRDENAQSQYAFLSRWIPVTRDMRVREEDRFGIFSRPEAIRTLTLKFWGSPWYYGSQRTSAKKGRLLVERISFLPAGAPTITTATNERIPVCDFEAEERVTTLGSDYGSWASSGPDGRCVESVAEDGGGHAWRIEYDNPAPKSFSGTWMKLSGVGVAPASALVFRARAVSGSPSFIVELKKRGTVARAVVSGLGRAWKPVRIPIAEFRGLGTPEDLEEMAFVFDEVVSPSRKGVVLVDDIAFE